VRNRPVNLCPTQKSRRWAERLANPTTSFVMDEPKVSRRLVVARLSLVLFIMGVLAPIVTTLAILRTHELILINWGNQPLQSGVAVPFFLGIGIGSLCEALALLLGIAGRRHASGKIGMIASFIVLALMVPFWLVWFSWLQRQ
jgi:hypothetical protein